MWDTHSEHPKEKSLKMLINKMHSNLTRNNIFIEPIATKEWKDKVINGSTNKKIIVSFSANHSIPNEDNKSSSTLIRSLTDTAKSIGQEEITIVMQSENGTKNNETTNLINELLDDHQNKKINLSNFQVHTIDSNYGIVDLLMDRYRDTISIDYIDTTKLYDSVENQMYSVYQEARKKGII